MNDDLQQARRFETGLRSLVRWGLYPASWAVLLVGAALEVRNDAATMPFIVGRSAWIAIDHPKS